MNQTDKIFPHLGRLFILPGFSCCLQRGFGNGNNRQQQQRESLSSDIRHLIFHLISLCFTFRLTLVFLFLLRCHIQLIRLGDALYAGAHEQVVLSGRRTFQKSHGGSTDEARVQILIKSEPPLVSWMVHIQRTFSPEGISITTLLLHDWFHWLETFTSEFCACCDGSAPADSSLSNWCRSPEIQKNSWTGCQQRNTVAVSFK